MPSDGSSGWAGRTTPRRRQTLMITKTPLGIRRVSSGSSERVLARRGPAAKPEPSTTRRRHGPGQATACLRGWFSGLGGASRPAS